MDMECGKEYLAIAIWGNGNRVKLMDTECTSGRTVINTRVHGKNVSNMEKVLIYLLMATCSPESMLMANLKEKESINGKMGVFTKENSRME